MPDRKDDLVKSNPPIADGSGGRMNDLPTIGEFEIQEVIGRGGMGTVYKAWQRSLQRTVALKVLAQHVGASPKAIERFQREARAAGSLHHSHIIPIFARGEENGTYYYAMEYIEGRSLHDIINEERGKQLGEEDTVILAETVPLDRATKHGRSEHRVLKGESQSKDAAGTGVRLESSAASRASSEHFDQIAQHLANVADGLQFAHDQGIVHRDIKPHNLMLGNDNRMRIADFGLARVAQQPGMTQTGEMVGSPLYMSPEQISGDASGVDHRTDIYSLGVTMYEWLTLRPPHVAETREAVIRRILSDEPSLLRSRNPDIPIDLETICLKAMERDPSQRYRTSAEFRDDLRRFMESRAIKARRASLIQRSRRIIGRHPMATLGSAAALVALSLSWALLDTKSQVKEQTQQIAKAEEQIDDLLQYLVRAIPGSPAALPVIEGLMETGQLIKLQSDSGKKQGAQPRRVTTVKGIAQRMMVDLYDEVESESSLTAGADRSGNGSVESSLLLAAWRTRHSDPESARSTARSYVDSNGDDLHGLQLLTVLCGQVGDYAAMLAHAKTMVQRFPGNPTADLLHRIAQLSLGVPSSAPADMKTGTEFQSIAHWVAALQGLFSLNSNQPGAAMIAFNECLDARPGQLVALLGRASAYRLQGEFMLAVADLSSAIEQEPQNADLWAARGYDHFTAGDSAHAIEDYNQAKVVGGPSHEIDLLEIVASIKQRYPRVDDTGASMESKTEDGEKDQESKQKSLLDALPSFIWRRSP